LQERRTLWYLDALHWLCVQVGVLKALEMAAQHQKPLLRVHHMEAHALVARLLPNAEVVAVPC
jgi:N6-L-threonylcarbamoyladenine synthase